MLPLSLVVNTTFPYDEKLASARRFLDLKGIRDPRPVRKSLPRSEAYEAWLAQKRSRLRVVREPLAH